MSLGKNNHDEMKAQIAALQKQVDELTEEKTDLEMLLQTVTEHADRLETLWRKKAQTALMEKDELEILLETTTEHADKITRLLQEQAEKEVVEGEKRLAQFLEAMPIGVIVVDNEGKLYYANHKAQEILSKKIVFSLHQTHKLGLKKNHKKFSVTQNSPGLKESIGLSLSEIFCVYLAGTQSVYPLEQFPLLKALLGQTAQVDDIELHQSNQIIPLEMLATPIFNAQGEVHYAIAIFKDITGRKQAEAQRIRLIQEQEAKQVALQMNARLQQEITERQRAEAALQKANGQLERLASLDGLTQVANRRRLDDYLLQAWKRLTEEQAPLSFILCDVDYFKRYNDTYGHQAGDICLQQVAEALCRAVKRSNDLVARYGGEEFAVVLPQTNLEGAITVAKRLQEEIKALQLIHTQSSVDEYVTLSIGLATMIPSAQSSAEQLINHADHALYQAKQAGRNRINYFYK
jgi:diguanylate cyclase (GGDEF)-like protein